MNCYVCVWLALAVAIVSIYFMGGNRRKMERFQNALRLIVISTIIQCTARVINFAIQFQPTVWWADKLLTQPPSLPQSLFKAIISNKTIKISMFFFTASLSLSPVGDTQITSTQFSNRQKKRSNEIKKKKTFCEKTIFSSY